LAVRLGVEPELDQGAAYIEGWLEALKSDKSLIFKAAAEAQKAVDFVLAAADADTIAEDARAQPCAVAHASMAIRHLGCSATNASHGP
jgi:antirestriction protein ArdC